MKTTNDKVNAALKATVAYFYNEHYGAYFGVSQYTLNPNGTYQSGIPTGVYSKSLMDEAGVPYKGVKAENPNINYL